MNKDKLETLFSLYRQEIFKNTIKAKSIKAELNSLIKKEYSLLDLSNTDNKSPEVLPVNSGTPAESGFQNHESEYQDILKTNKIAIVIDKLSHEKSLYKEIYPFVESLFREYELTLILLGKWNNTFPADEYRNKINQHIFKNKIFINDYSEFEKLNNNNFALAYFLTHSMDLEATILPGLRLAPIQITGYGNPVSSYGEDFDYFITGELIENIEKIKDNYSEKVVLLPELSLIPSFQDYDLKSIENAKPINDQTDNFIIGCCCSVEQSNFNYLVNLKKILELVKKPVKFIFFCNCNKVHSKISESLEQNSFSIVKYLKTDPDFNYYLAASKLILDTSFFTDYKLIIKALFLGKPVVTLEGEEAANRLSSGILKKLNLHELIANRENAFLVKAIKLINDDNYREKIVSKIQSIDIKEELFSTNEFQYFKKAISYLIENHNILKNDKNPVFIKDIFEKEINAKSESDQLQKFLLNLYQKGEYEKLSEEFIKKIEYFGYDMVSDSKVDLIILNSFTKIFLEIFIKSDFIIPEGHILFYIKLNALISNLICLSDFDTSDPHLIKMLDEQYTDIEFTSKNQFVKVLTLYSMRNNIKLNYKNLFDYDKTLSSLWYWRYFVTDNFSGKFSYINIQKHIHNIDTIINLLEYKDIIDYAYFSVTYGSIIHDKNVKAGINNFIQEKYKSENVSELIYVPDIQEQSPKTPKVAIISSLFYPSHSVHRGLYKFIEALKDDYELVLICPGNYPKDMDTSLFKKVIQLNFDNGNFDLSGIDNDFSLVFYPDIGMNKESMYLANKRLAPIQVTGHGHSVSTFGAKIDYFISGIESEIIEKANENYSERLVLIPGIGLDPTYPTYSRNNINKNNDSFIIACPWTSKKINYQHLINLKEIQEKSAKKIIFRFFPGLIENSYLFSLKKEIAHILGKNNIEIVTATNTEYMPLFEQTDIAIDSYHFGGFNTIVDALYLGKPIITLEGNKAFNKFAGGLLRKLDLAELIAINKDEYIKHIVNIINDDEYRQKISHKIENINLKDKLFDSDEPEYFKKAIDYLIKNHRILKQEKIMSPIIIQ